MMTKSKKNQSKTVDYPFCRQPWHLGAMLLGFGFLFTFVWAFHLLHDLDDELAVWRFAKDKRGSQSAPEKDMVPVAMNRPLPGKSPEGAQGFYSQGQSNAMMNPTVAWSVRASLVGIVGLRSVDTQTPAEFITAGSGVLVTADGHIATAAHVIEGLKEILVRVQTPSGPRQYTAQLVKSAAKHDVAILKLVSRDIFPFSLLSPETRILKPGDSVIAWGDPNGTNALVSRGAVTQIDVASNVDGRPLTHLLRTEAVTHWSQSGGPLVNDQGLVVGINIVAQSAMGVVGFAVPADVLWAHFQDVVNFPIQSAPPLARQSPTVAAGAVMTRPVAMTMPSGSGLGGGLAHVSGENGGGGAGRRYADRWWAQAQAEYGLGLSKRNSSYNPPFADLGIHVAAVYPQPRMIPAVHTPEQRYWGYDLNTLFGLLALGLISGISGGMMTMGGGIIKVTGLLVFFGYGMLLIRPVAYITNIFLYGAAVLRYRRYKLILWDSVRSMIPWAMVGVVLGYFIGNAMSTLFIRYLLGVFAALVGVRMLVEIISGSERKKRWEELHPQSVKSKKPGLLLRYFGMGDVDFEGNLTHRGILGLPMGIISGILGITGGVIEVPLQRYVVGVPLRNAIANSAVLVFCASSVGSVVAMAHGIQTGAFDWSTPIKLAVILIPGAYVGGLIGAWLTKMVPLGVLRWIYAVLMFVIAVRMFFS